MDTDALQAILDELTKMRTFSAPLGCSRKLTRRQRIACDEPGNTLAAFSRNPNAYTQHPRPNTEPLRYAEESQRRRNQRKRKRVAWQQQPRRARRKTQYLAAQHSIGDRSLQHALFAINRAPRGVIIVTILAVPFDNSVLRPSYARTNATVPTPTSALRFPLQSRFKRVRLFCDPTGCRSSALQGHLLNSTWKNERVASRE